MHPRARIYRPAKTAMQSGMKQTRRWMLEFVSPLPLGTDPLMGWNSSSNTLRQVRMCFRTKQEAVDYAKAHGLAYDISEPHKSAFKPKNYAENFRFDAMRDER